MPRPTLAAQAANEASIVRWPRRNLRAPGHARRQQRALADREHIGHCGGGTRGRPASARPSTPVSHRTCASRRSRTARRRSSLMQSQPGANAPAGTDALARAQAVTVHAEVGLQRRLRRSHFGDGPVPEGLGRRAQHFDAERLLGREVVVQAGLADADLVGHVLEAEARGRSGSGSVPAPPAGSARGWWPRPGCWLQSSTYYKVGNPENQVAPNRAQSDRMPAAFTILPLLAYSLAISSAKVSARPPVGTLSRRQQLGAQVGAGQRLVDLDVVAARSGSTACRPARRRRTARTGWPPDSPVRPASAPSAGCPAAPARRRPADAAGRP